MVVLTINESSVLRKIIIEELAEYGLLRAVREKIVAAKDISLKVAKRFDEHLAGKETILLYEQSSLEQVILAEIDRIEAKLV